MSGSEDGLDRSEMADPKVSIINIIINITTILTITNIIIITIIIFTMLTKTILRQQRLDHQASEATPRCMFAGIEPQGNAGTDDGDDGGDDGFCFLSGVFFKKYSLRLLHISSPLSSL